MSNFPPFSPQVEKNRMQHGGSFNKSLENPRNGAHSIENNLVLVSIITY